GLGGSRLLFLVRLGLRIAARARGRGRVLLFSRRLGGAVDLDAIGLGSSGFLAFAFAFTLTRTVLFLVAAVRRGRARVVRLNFGGRFGGRLCGRLIDSVRFGLGLSLGL